MENLMTGVNYLFNNFFWTQLTNASNWFINNPIGQIIIFMAIVSLIIGLIIYIITIGKSKIEE